MIPHHPILCIGGAVIDRTYLCANEPSPGTSNPVSNRRSFGGVARNVAESLARLGATVRLITAIGDDEAGRALVAGLAAMGTDLSGVLTVPDQPTAEYTAAFWQGELFAGFADMAIFDRLTPEAVLPVLPKGARETLVFADCNLPQATLLALASQALTDGFPLCVDALSLAKAERLPPRLDGVHVLFLNAAQARHITKTEALPEAIDRLRARGAQAIVLTQGADGVSVCNSNGTKRLPPPAVSVLNVSGAGDAIIAGTLLGLSEGQPLTDAVHLGLAAAALALQSMETVPPGLTRATLEASKERYDVR